MGAAAGLLSAVPWDGNEGPRPQIVIAPGVVAFERVDQSKRERAYEKGLRRHQVDIAMLSGQLSAGQSITPEVSRRIVEEWSRRSRSRMVRRIAELDFEPMMSQIEAIPGMITLTYPRCWLRVVPTGKDVKRHLDQFERRWERAWGERPRGIWKLEFQARQEGQRCHCEGCDGLDDGRAPHIHIYAVPPLGQAGEARRQRALESGKYYRRAVGDGLTFRHWLSAVWTDIVGHPDKEQRRLHLAAGTALDFAEGMRSSDPKRLAIYFTKHGTFAAKNYQHNVPKAWQEPGKGPGRFWGYWRLEKAAQTVPVSWEDYQSGVRVARRWAAAQGVTRQVTVQRVEQATGRIRYRTVRRPVKRLGMGAGFVCVNDGAAFGSALARAVEVMRAGPPSGVVSQHLPKSERQAHGINVLLTAV